MTRVYQFATHGYALADAQHVLKAVTKHWPSLQPFGAIDSERKRFAATIAEAERFADPKAHGPVALEEARQALKDLLGSYRSAASLIVHGIDGRDAKAEEALKTKGQFPGNDVALSAYARAIASKLKGYAAKLAQRGFSKEQQGTLSPATAAFDKAFAARGKERGEARAVSLARETLFKKLRTETSYFRKLGHEALRSSVMRADFDRVQVSKGKPALAAVPAPPAAASRG